MMKASVYYTHRGADVCNIPIVLRGKKGHRISSKKFCAKAKNFINFEDTNPCTH